MQPKDTEESRRAIDRVNRAYADEDYDRYERLIERYCHRFGFEKLLCSFTAISGRG